MVFQMLLSLLRASRLTSMPLVSGTLLLSALAIGASGQGRPDVRWIKSSFVGSHVSQVAISPNGTTLAIAGGSRIDLYDLATGRCLRSLTARGLHPGTFALSVAWSRDSRTLVSTGIYGEVWLFRASTGALLAQTRTNFATQPSTSAAFSPDGARIVTATPGGTTLDVWNAINLTLVRRIAAVGARCVAYSPEGNTLAVGYDDRRVRLLDATTGATVRTLTGHTARINDVAFSPDGTRLVSGSDDGRARIWNAATSSTVFTLVHQSGVEAVDFASNGQLVATASLGRLTAWRATDGQEIRRVSTSTVTFAVCFGLLSDTVIGPDGPKVAEWDLSSGAEVREFTVGGWSPKQIAMDPTGDRVALASDTLRVFRGSDGEPLGDFGWFAGAPSDALAWSQDGSTIYSRNGQTVSGWNVATGTKVSEFTIQESGYNFPSSFSKDATRLAVSTSWTGNPPDTVAAYDVSSGARLWRIAGLNAPALAVSPDGTRLALLTILPSGSPGPLRVLNMENGSPILSVDLPYEAGDPLSVALSPNGQEVAVGTSWGYLLFVDVAYGTIREYWIHPWRRVESVTYHVYGGRLFVGGDAVLQIVRPFDGRVLAMYGEETSGGVLQAETSPMQTGWCYSRGDGAVVMADLPDTSQGAIIRANDTRGSIGTNVVLSATLTDANDVPLADREVHFWRDMPWWGPGYLGSAVTDGSGVARLGHIVGEPAGGQSFYVAFSGGDGYQYAEDEGGLLVDQATTRLFTLDRTGAIHTSVAFRAFLTTTAGVPIPNKWVTFSVAGSPVGSALTDIGGRATLWYVLPNNLLPGPHELRAVFAGDGSLPSATGTATLTVTQGTINLWVMPRSIQRGTAAYLRAFARSAILLTPLPGLEVGYTLEGTYLGSAVTDANGRASLLYTVPAGTSPGVLTLQCTFAGNAYYLPANGSAPITVTP